MKQTKQEQLWLRKETQVCDSHFSSLFSEMSLKMSTKFAASKLAQLYPKNLLIQPSLTFQKAIPGEQQKGESQAADTQQ